MAYIDQVAILNDGTLQARIMVAARMFIQNVLKKETDTTPNRAARQAFGTNFALNESNYTNALVNLGIASGVTTASTDAQIDTAVAAVWDRLAGGDPYRSLVTIALAEVAVTIIGDPSLGGTVTDTAVQAAYAKEAQKVFRNLSGYTEDSAIGIGLKLAQASKDASTATLADVITAVKALMPGYVATAPAS